MSTKTILSPGWEMVESPTSNIRWWKVGPVTILQQEWVIRYYEGEGPDKNLMDTYKEWRAVPTVEE